MSLPSRTQSHVKVPFNNLVLQWRQIESEVLPELKLLFETSAFSLGRWVDRFENEMCSYLGALHAIGVNSGTSALHLATIAAGITPGDKVLVPANTFVATAWAVLYVGGEPVFCDVDPASWTIDLSDAERRLSSDVKAIFAVHLYGQPAKMGAITAFAKNYGLAVIEDVAQAVGARYGSRALGTIGEVGCFSFYPGKNLGAAGEAGLVVVGDEAMARRIRALRHHAQSERYVHSELGFNYRMEGIQALILSHKLKMLDKWTNERRRVASCYMAELIGLPLELPAIVNGDHVWHLFVVHTRDRDRLRARLADLNIETGLHYALPLHRQPCFAKLPMDRSSYPNADRSGRECLSLPIFSGMTDAQIDAVIAGVRSFFK